MLILFSELIYLMCVSCAGFASCIAGIPGVYFADTCAVACGAFWLSVSMLASPSPRCSSVSTSPLLHCSRLLQIAQMPAHIFLHFLSLRAVHRTSQQIRFFHYSNETCGPEIVQLKYLCVVAVIVVGVAAS